MAGLPIRKMTLYKHGVGYFVRQGTTEGETVALAFRTEEMNDVLKSLTAVATGGQVLGVDYQTPEDKAALLARSSIQLSDYASLRDLLRDLRGRRVHLTTTGDTLTGIVVGVDLPAEREPMAAVILSLWLPESRAVRPLRLGDVLSLVIEDERGAADLAYFLETSLTEEAKRAVTIRLSGQSELTVSYIAPSPVWRVSYRLVADETKATAGESTAGLLQGWGLFDNTLDEDLENVAITFVAGMPVSFIYDLYTPFTPPRPVIQEQARGVAGPVEFEEAVEAAPRAASMLRSAKRGMVAEERAFGAGVQAAAFSAEDIAASTAVTATGQAQGEFFSYVVANPVTVRRGRSAMVPILQTPLQFRKERIYNGRKHPQHPVITMRFKNETGLTLERGPLTVAEAGEYAGEAMLPFTAPDGELFLAYAVDLGITVTETPEVERRLAAVDIKDGLLVIQEWDVQSVAYRIENRNDAPASVTLEHPRLPNYTPFETPEAEDQTPEYHRYVVSVPAHGAADFTARQRRMLARREEIRKHSLDQLARWLRDKVLDEATFERVRGVLALYDRIGEHEAAIKRNEAQRQEIFGQQKVIQGNLASLRESGEEGQLRARYARTLQELEDRLAQLKQDDEAQRAAIAAAQGEIQTALKAL
jgi:hypothetical protein